MKKEVSILLAALCLLLIFLADPKKILFTWSINHFLEEANYSLVWDQGRYVIEEPFIKWPSQEFKKDWRTTLALFILEKIPSQVNAGTLFLNGKHYVFGGVHAESTRFWLKDGQELICSIGEEIKFKEAPLEILRPFFPLKNLYEGSISGTFNKELIISNLKYQEMNLDILFDKIVIHGNQFDCHKIHFFYENQALWSIDELPLMIHPHLNFSINTDRPVFIKDLRLKVSSSLNQLQAKGLLRPLKLEEISFSMSSIFPNELDSPLREEHNISCDYKENRKSYFILFGNELCFELNMDQEKTFLAEVSDSFLKQFKLDSFPIRKMQGRLHPTPKNWEIEGVVDKGTIRAFFTSLLLPQARIQEICLNLEEWKHELGPLFKKVIIHYTPKQIKWSANTSHLHFEGTDWNFNGGGPLESWKEFLASIKPTHPFCNIPLEGFCFIQEGILKPDGVEFTASLQEGSFEILKDLTAKIEYMDGSLSLKDLKATFPLQGKNFFIFSPAITYSERLEFDCWIADAFQDYIRLKGIGIFTSKDLHLEFDHKKTHLFNITPSLFDLRLREWSTLSKLEFIGVGPFNIPLFEHINRWIDQDFRVDIHYDEHSLENPFLITKGPFELAGEIKKSIISIARMDLDLPSIQLNSKGTLDLKNLELSLDPIQLTLDFVKSPSLNFIPLTGKIRALGTSKATFNKSCSDFIVTPQDLHLGIIALSNDPFPLHQEGEEFTFTCKSLFNDSYLTTFDCLLNKKGLKAVSPDFTLLVGNTHFALHKGDLKMQCRYSPTFSLLTPIDAPLESILGSHFPLQGGTISLHLNHCSITNTTLWNKPIANIEFDYDILNFAHIQLKNMHLQHEDEAIQIPVALLEFTQNRLNKLTSPLIQGANINLSTLQISRFKLSDFSSTYPFKSFAANGRLHFTNLFSILAPFCQNEYLSDFDTKWVLPNQGDLVFTATEENLILEELKECFSPGKTIRFETASEQVPTMFWDGTFNLPLKLKPQHLSFKWGELFTLNLKGSIQSPLLELSKKR